MKNGNRSLYLHNKSSISSANPNKIVPNIVVNTDICIVKFSGVDQIRKATVIIMPIIENAIAAANPTHYGIYFSPPLLPFLLISRPNIRF